MTLSLNPVYRYFRLLSARFKLSASIMCAFIFLSYTLHDTNAFAQSGTLDHLARIETSFKTIADHAGDKSKLGETRMLYQKIIELQRENSDVSDKQLARTYQLLANLERDYGHYDLAEPYYLETQYLLRKAPGDVEMAALLYADIGHYHALTNRSNSAYHFYALAMPILNQTLEMDDPLRLMHAVRYGRFLMEFKAYRAAKALLSETLEHIPANWHDLQDTSDYWQHTQHHPFSPHKIIIALRMALGDLYMAENAASKAQQHYQRAYMIVKPMNSRKVMMGNDNIYRLQMTVQIRLANILQNQGNLEEAQNILSQADKNCSIVVFDQLSQLETDAMLKNCWNNRLQLADIYVQKQEYANALAYYEQLVNDSKHAKESDLHRFYFHAIEQQVLIAIKRNDTASAAAKASYYLDQVKLLPADLQAHCAKRLILIGDMFSNIEEVQQSALYYEAALTILQGILPASDPNIRRLRLYLRDLEGKNSWPEQEPVELEERFFDTAFQNISFQ